LRELDRKQRYRPVCSGDESTEQPESFLPFGSCVYVVLCCVIVWWRQYQQQM